MDKQSVLKQVFGFDQFRPGQEQVIDSLLAGRSVLAVMPTGAGKSLCFQLPALIRGGIAVVVSPLVALMDNQVSALKADGIAAGTIHSGKTRADNVAVWRQVRDGDLRLLYLSPERISGQSMMDAIAALPVSFLVIDEAHCISQWGHDFRPDYLQLGNMRDRLPDVPVAAFTATADKTTRSDILTRLFQGKAEMFVHGFDRPNISLAVEEKNKPRDRLRALMDEHKDEQGIIYCLSRKSVERTSDSLNKAGHKTLPYHAGMDSEVRLRTLDRFLSEDGLSVVATVAFGMGIDKPDIRFVFHGDIPASIESYYQEIGRAGRDGLAARSVMLYGFEDIRTRQMMIDEGGASEEQKRLSRQKLYALTSLCEATACRRRMLLSYFDEDSEPCGNCDLCREPPRTIDGTDLARAILATVKATGQSFGQAHVLDVLLGRDTEKIRRFCHHRLDVYGGSKQHKIPDPAWRSVMRQLYAADIVSVDFNKFGALKITRRGRDILDGNETAQLRMPPPKNAPAAKQEKKVRSAAPAAPAAAVQEKKVRSAPAATAAPAQAETGERPPPPPDAALLAKLKALRSKLARERHVPAYIIFGDRSLIDMARHKPRTPPDFANVFGVGEQKLRAFAKPFMEIIQRHEQNTGG